MSTLAEWMRARHPPAPGRLLPWVAVESVDGAPADDVLTQRALEQLSRSVRAPGRNRQSAFYLLAADALLTYACEAALERGDPEATLNRILDAVGAAER